MCESVYVWVCDCGCVCDCVCVCVSVWMYWCVQERHFLEGTLGKLPKHNKSQATAKLHGRLGPLWDQHSDALTQIKRHCTLQSPDDFPLFFPVAGRSKAKLERMLVFFSFFYFISPPPLGVLVRGEKQSLTIGTCRAGGSDTAHTHSYTHSHTHSYTHSYTRALTSHRQGCQVCLFEAKYDKFGLFSDS